MLRDLQETDVKAICDINQEALSYSFSQEETASQLDRLSQDSHHFLLGYEDEVSHALLGYVHAEVYESLYSKAGFNILALAVSPLPIIVWVLMHFMKKLVILVIKCRNGLFASFSLFSYYRTKLKDQSYYKGEDL